VEAQIRALLEDHNYVVMRDGTGAIQSIIVSGQKADKPALPQQISVHTTRQGSNHFVEAVILGERPARLHVKLMLDTGASQVVLPKSMLEELGFVKDASGGVRDAVLQTANGSVNGYVATLRAVEVGQALETDVPVAFIDDELLGGNKLLGMSFLGRFVVTLDDAAGTLRLSPRSR
jgi:aspartyl protease family protein